MALRIARLLLLWCAVASSDCDRGELGALRARLFTPMPNDANRERPVVGRWLHPPKTGSQWCVTLVRHACTTIFDAALRVAEAKAAAGSPHVLLPFQGCEIPASDEHRKILKSDCAFNNGHNPTTHPRMQLLAGRAISVTVLREPGSRLVSAFEDGPHVDSKGGVPANASAMRASVVAAKRAARSRACGAPCEESRGPARAACLAAQKCGAGPVVEESIAGFDAFLRWPGAAGCYTRLLCGAGCNDGTVAVNDARLQYALRRLASDFIFVGLQARRRRAPFPPLPRSRATP
jgi:hypothetical protein